MSVVLTCRKVRAVDARHVPTEILSPQQSLNQLALQRYSAGHAEILTTLSSYHKLKELVSTKRVPASVRMCVALRLYQFVQFLQPFVQTAALNVLGSQQNLRGATIGVLLKRFLQ